MNLTKCAAAVTALALSLATAAFTNAAPSQALTAPHATSIETTWAAAILGQLNSERRAHHLLALRMNQHLVNSAMYHNARMARANTLSHQLSHEMSFSDRETAFGYHWYTAAENCAVNPDVSVKGVLQLQSMMYGERPPGETGHRQNILSRNYRDVGIGVLVDKINHRVWLTEDFGAPA